MRSVVWHATGDVPGVTLRFDHCDTEDNNLLCDWCMEFDNTGYGIHDQGKYWHRHCRVEYYKELHNKRVDKMTTQDLRNHIQILIGLHEVHGHAG
jgi:hypothetical protein